MKKIFYSFEEGIAPILDGIVEAQTKKEQDYLILIGGSEGLGKSTLAFECIDYIDTKRGYFTSIDNITGDIADFAKALYFSKPKDQLLLDEGKELARQNWHQKEVKAFNETITTVRMDSHIYYICFRNPSTLIGYVKNDKVCLVMLLRSRVNAFTNIVYVYTRQRFNEILESLKVQSLDNIFKEKPTLKVYCKLYKSRLWNDYLLKKRTFVDEAKQKFYQKMIVWDNNKKIINTTEAAKILNVTNSSIYRLVGAGVLPCVRTVGGHIRFDWDNVMNLSKDPDLRKKCAAYNKFWREKKRRPGFLEDSHCSQQSNTPTGAINSTTNVLNDAEVLRDPE